MIDIDNKDKKILYELDLNGRATYSEMGKSIRLSKQSIKKRIKNLESTGVIKQYFALINIHKLGYSFYRLDIKLHNTTLRKEKEIINYILGLPNVIWVADLYGKWDLAVVFLTKNIVDTDDNIRNIKWKFNKYIQDESFCVSTTHSRYKHGFLIGSEKEKKEVFMGRELENVKLSSIENKVLSILSRNGRESLINISQKTGKSIGSVKNAINNLKEKRVLLGFSVLIDMNKIGYSHHKLFINFQNPTMESEMALERYFRVHPNIIFMTKSIGRSDIECEIITKNIQEFKDVIRDMKHRFPDLVKDIDSYMVLNEYTTNYYPI